MSYITEGDLENYILQDIDASFSTWIASVIAGVESYIDNYCGTKFANTGIAEDRYYDGSGSDELILGPVQSVSAVVFLTLLGDTYATLSTDNYILYPQNSEVNDTKYILKLRHGSFYSNFPNYPRSVKITGIFGTTTPPLAVKMAGIKLAAKIINDGLRGGQVSRETLGSYSVIYEKVDEVSGAMEIKEILNQYRVMSLD